MSFSGSYAGCYRSFVTCGGSYPSFCRSFAAFRRSHATFYRSYVPFCRFYPAFRRSYPAFNDSYAPCPSRSAACRGSYAVAPLAGRRCVTADIALDVPGKPCAPMIDEGRGERKRKLLFFGRRLWAYDAGGPCAGAATSMRLGRLRP